MRFPCWSDCRSADARLRAQAAIADRQIRALAGELETTRALAIERPRTPYRGEIDGLDARVRALGRQVHALTIERDATRWTLTQLRRRRFERWAIAAIGGGLAFLAMAVLIAPPAPRPKWEDSGYAIKVRNVVTVEASTHVSIGVGVVAGPETSAAMGVPAVRE